MKKRNQEEEAIEELIKDFEAKIDLFFEYVKGDDSGKRLIAKMKDEGLAFDSEEIYNDFAIIFRKFIRRNNNLGEFFIKETKEIVNQLCDDFERTLKIRYVENDLLREAADKEYNYSREYTGYLFFDTNNFLTAENTFIQYRNFANSIGFELLNEGEFIKGSWIKKGIKLIHKAANSEEAKKLIVKGKKGLELAYLDKIQSEVNKNNSEAAKFLMDAVKDIPNAAIKMGSLIIVKTTNEEIPSVLILNLTMEQVIELDKNPMLMNNPLKLTQYLNSI